jgi:hypothetical protein
MVSTFQMINHQIRLKLIHSIDPNETNNLAQ